MFVSGVRNLETEVFRRAEPGDKPCAIEVTHTSKTSKCSLCSHRSWKKNKLFQAAAQKSPAQTAQGAIAFGHIQLCIPLNKCTGHSILAAHPQVNSEVHFPRHSLTCREQEHTTYPLNHPKRDSVTSPALGWLCCPVSIPHCTAEPLSRTALEVILGRSV